MSTKLLPSSIEAGNRHETERTGLTSTTQTTTSTSTIADLNIPDKASGSRGPLSADAMDKPELADNLRRSLANSDENQNINTARRTILVQSWGSRGPVGAEVIAPPEPADNLRHPMAARRGTEKGGNSYSPEDNVGSKAITMNQDDEGFKSGEPCNENGERNKDEGHLLSANPPALPQLARLNAREYDRLQRNLYGSMWNNQPSSTRSNTRIVASCNRLLTASRSFQPTSPESTQGSVSNANLVNHRTRIAIQWNMNGYFHNLSDLESMVRDNPPITLAIAVHRANKDAMEKTLSCQYNWLLKKGKNIHQSVALGIHTSVAFTPINVSTELLIVAARILVPFPISVVSFYFPSPGIPNLDELFNNAMEQIAEPRLVMGDCNGHHSIWGSKKSDIRGTTILKSAEKQDMIILNDGSLTFLRGQVESAIDISLANSTIANRLLWSCHDDPRGSDHRPIEITTNDHPPETTRRPRWRYEAADWGTFEVLMNAYLEDNSPTDIEDFLESIYSAAKMSIPRTSPNPGRRALHWWTAETRSAIKARRKAMRAAKRLPNEHPQKSEAVKEYNRQRNRCRQIIRDAKRQSWEEFLETINSNQSATELWRKVNAVSGKRKSKGMAIRCQSGISRDPEVVADTLADYFADLSAINNYSETFLRRNKASTSSISTLIIAPDLQDSPINQPFSMAELTFALAGSKGKSEGPDNIGYPMLKHLPIRGKQMLLQKLNDCWQNDLFPVQWGHSLVIPIPKNGSSSTEPKDFRPIALTSCVCKIYERIINRRLTTFLRENQLLDHRQHAFRQGFGTGTYFASLGQVLDDALKDNMHVDVAVLDLSKAYNRAWTPGVLKKLQEWGLAGHILRSIQNFLSNRTFQVAIGNTKSKTVSEETGVPQGSVLAVTLFLVAMNGIFKCLPKGVFIFVYADDIVLVVVGKHPKMIRRKLQAATRAVAKWADSAGFQLSANKSIITHLCMDSHHPWKWPISIAGEEIPYKKQVRVLGVILDRKLSFKPHFTAVRENCQSRIRLLRVITSRHRSSNRNIALRIASAVVTSRLLYGVEITCRAADLMVAMLGPIYNRCIRTISGLLPSTPEKAACIETGVLPFRHILTISTCSKAVSYLERTTGENEGVFLLTEANKLLRYLTNLELPPVSEVHWVGDRAWNSPQLHIDWTIKNSFRAGTNSVRLHKTYLEFVSTKLANHKLIFTDGSKARGHVGIGVFGPNMNRFFRLPDQSTVFTAEAVAIFIATSEAPAGPVAILTDSASVLSALESFRNRHPWIQAIHRVANNNLRFVWIPGHCEISGNESADQLASVGRETEFYNIETPADDIKTWVKMIIRNAWRQSWYQERWLFLRKVKGEIEKWTDQPNWKDQRILSRLRTGHTRATHDYSRAHDMHKQCDVCQIQLSVEHMLVNCPKYENHRRTYGIQDGIRDVLSNDPSHETALLCLLKDAELYTEI